MKKFFAARHHATDADLTYLLLRFVMGAAFIFHGWGKIQSPMSWMGADSAIPGIFQFLAALSEFGGGICLILGFLTRLASLGLVFTMIVAVYFHAVILGDPFVSKVGGSYELGALYLVLSLLFVVCGPGRFSLDSKIFGHQ